MQQGERPGPFQKDLRAATGGRVKGESRCTPETHSCSGLFAT